MVERRREVLNTLRSSPSPMSIVELANRTGLHPNTVRFHLRRLVGDGCVDQVQDGRRLPGRQAMMYRAHVGMDPTGPRNYALLAGALAGLVATDQESGARATTAGRALGRGLVGSDTVSDGGAVTDQQAAERLVALLDELGFAPERDPARGGSIGLRHCPFLDLVPEHAEVICPLHLGLMQGALDALEARITVTHLEPFAEPDLCLAHTGQAERAS